MASTLIPAGTRWGHRTGVDHEESALGRWARGLAAGVVVVSVLSACGGAASNETRPPEEPAEQVEVGDCFAAGSDEPVSCGRRHVAQAIYVSDEPPAGNAEAITPCRRAQAHFLGQDFNTRLDVKLWVAQDESWYRCDVLLRRSTQAVSGYEPLTESLQGVLRKDADVELQACLDAAFDPTADQVYVPCDEPHIARELIVAPAIGTLGEPFPNDVVERATNACNATADAAGELVDGRTVSAFYPASAAAWATGERSADCWVTADRGSLPPVTQRPR